MTVAPDKGHSWYVFHENKVLSSTRAKNIKRVSAICASEVSLCRDRFKTCQ